MHEKLEKYIDVHNNISKKEKFNALMIFGLSTLPLIILVLFKIFSFKITANIFFSLMACSIALTPYAIFKSAIFKEEIDKNVLKDFSNLKKGDLVFRSDSNFDFEELQEYLKVIKISDDNQGILLQDEKTGEYLEESLSIFTSFYTKKT